MRTGFIKHSPSVCKDPNNCVYLFSAVNNFNRYVTISFRANSESYNPGDINLKLSYQNTVPYGKFVNYEINPISNKDIQPFLQSLTIKLYTISGDADLFVSFTRANPTKENSLYFSRKNDFID